MKVEVWVFSRCTEWNAEWFCPPPFNGINISATVYSWSWRSLRSLFWFWRKLSFRLDSRTSGRLRESADRKGSGGSDGWWAVCHNSVYYLSIKSSVSCRVSVFSSPSTRNTNCFMSKCCSAESRDLNVLLLLVESDSDEDSVAIIFHRLSHLRPVFGDSSKNFKKCFDVTAQLRNGRGYFSTRNLVADPKVLELIQ